MLPTSSRVTDQARHVAQSGHRRLGASIAAMGARPVLVVALSVAVLVWLILGIITTQWVNPHTRVGGYEVGTSNPRRAASQVAQQLDADLFRSSSLTLPGRNDTAGVPFVPAESGLSVTAQHIEDELAGFTLNPVTIVDRLTGASLVPAVQVDADVLTSQLSTACEELATPAQSAGVSISDGEAARVAAVPGQRCDMPAARKLLSGWPWGQKSIALPAVPVAPAVTDTAMDDFIAQRLQPLLAGPITLSTAGTPLEQAHPAGLVLTPAAVGEAIVVDVDDVQGRVDMSLDATVLGDQLQAELGAEPGGYRGGWSIEGSPEGHPVYQPGDALPPVDVDALARTLSGGLADEATRTIPLPIAAGDDWQAQAEQSWGITQVVAEYSTPYSPSNLARTQNLVRGTAQINGHVVMPGEQFSVEAALGQVDEEHGFAEAGVLLAGQHVDAMGGGLSQVATTVFNAAFEAGMEDDEHWPHSVWLTRYPAGREATVWTGQKDVKFTNSTPYPVLLQAWAADGEVTVRLWSTPYYTVSVESSEHTNVRPPTTIERTGADCQDSSPGEAGFTITVTRHRSGPAGPLADDVLTTVYQPDHGTHCVN